jgi:mannitol/fructose-specific phosphotransferase system IIA component (Ntr-type)
MEISDYLDPENIILNLEGKSKEQIIRALIENLQTSDPQIDGEQAFYDLWEREMDYSTGLEDGIAFPHARTKAVTRHKLALGICRKGCDFESRDGEATHFIPLLLTPRSSGKPHIIILAEIIKKLEDKLIRQKLLEAQSAEEVYRLLE